MYFVYILQSIKDKSYYIGHTGHIESRLKEHNFGRTGYTSLKRPWKLVHKRKFVNRSQAIIMEKYLKKLKSKIALEKIIGSVGP
ncbi:MAG: GIY-YIG nuclease family protein [Patescibacteria group bacterium]